MATLMTGEREFETALLAKAQFARVVGAFEGAGYEAAGLYRSEQDCVMFSRNEVGFCRVCQRALGRVMDLYALP